MKFFSTHLKYKDHACDHGVHVVLAQLFAESRAHCGQGIQILLQNLFPHIGQHLRGVSLQVELHPAPMSLFCHTELLKAGLWIGQKFWGVGGEGWCQQLECLNSVSLAWTLIRDYLTLMFAVNYLVLMLYNLLATALAFIYIC